MRSKHYTPVYLILVTTILAVVLGGCASSSKDGAPPWDANADGSTTGGEYGTGIAGTDVSGGGSGLPGLTDGVNPGSADFSILRDYVVYFGFDKFTIDGAERGKIEQIAKYLKENGHAKIIIAGNTDSRGTTQYNLALGERRAIAVRDYLMGLGISGSRVLTVSYGEEKPAAQGESEDAWAKNRRAETGVLR